MLHVFLPIFTCIFWPILAHLPFSWPTLVFRETAAFCCLILHPWHKDLYPLCPCHAPWTHIRPGIHIFHIHHPLWIFSTAATHMTTSVTVSRTSADKVIHRGVITNMCTGWALWAVRSIHNIHSAHFARGRAERCIDVCSVLQCRYTIVTDHSSANSNEPCVASIWAVDSRYYIVYSRYYIVDKYTL